MTVLLTTHYMQEADALCDRVALMHHGRLQAVGSPRTEFEGTDAVVAPGTRHSRTCSGTTRARISARTPRRPACVRSGTAEGRRAVSVEQNVRRTDRPCAARLAPHAWNGHARGRFRGRGTAEAAPRPHRAVHQDGAARAVAADLRADVHPAARHRHRRRAVPGVPGTGHHRAVGAVHLDLLWHPDHLGPRRGHPRQADGDARAGVGADHRQGVRGRRALGGAGDRRAGAGVPARRAPDRQPVENPWGDGALWCSARRSSPACR